MHVFSVDFLNELTQQAAVSARRRQHRNIHRDYSEPCQKLFNAIEPDSYLPPHCHCAEQGSEMLIAVRGRMAVMIFDKDGGIEQCLLVGAGSSTSPNDAAIGVEIDPGTWHSVVSLEMGSILLEVKAGPFNPYAAKQIAPWAPPEKSTEVEKYLETLRRVALMTYPLE